MPFFLALTDPEAIQLINADTIGSNGDAGPVVVESRNGDFAIVAGDDRKLLLCSGGVATLPTDLPVGFSVSIMQGAAQVRFVGAPIRHFQGHDATLAQYGVAGLIVIEPGVYLLTGATAAA